MLLVYIFSYCLSVVYAHISLTRGTTQRFTVQFQSSTDNLDAVRNDHERFLSYLQQHNMMESIRVRYNYTDIMNGMSFELVQDKFSAASVRPVNHTVLQFVDYTLSTCPFVARYWPGKSYPRPKAASVELAAFFNMTVDEVPLYVDEGKPNLHAAHRLTTVDRAKRAGWTGEGIKVAVLDTGIDYTHPALGGCFGEGCKVRYGKDLVGDSFNGRKVNGNKLIQPDDDPIDQCDGHGTHIAGIIAANDTYKGFEGVAPGVTLGAWRIFGCEGDTDDDIIIAAAEMAVKSGMDVINLSIGGGLGSWQEDPLAVALSNIAKNNVTIVVAQGNEGKDGFERTPSPAIGEHLISVGSVDNLERYGSVIKLIRNNSTTQLFEYFLRDSIHFDMETEPMKYTVYACNLNSSVTEKVVVIQYDAACDYSSQLTDAVGILVYPNQHNHSIETILNDKQFDKFNIPVGMMSFEDGSLLVQETTLQSLIQFTWMTVKTKTGAKASDFSTWGPDPELHFKPDISAVGGYIYSTFPVNLGVYATLSGTSMATPYLSGCLALLMQATQIRDSKSLIKRLVNYAKPISTITNDSVYENPIKQGSGLVQVYYSIIGHSSITPSIISLNDSAHFVNKTCITVRNQSNVTQLFRLESVPSIGIEGYNFSESAVPLLKPMFHSIYTNITFEKSILKIRPYSSQQTCIVIEQPTWCAKKHAIYGGFLRLSSVDNDSVSHVPYFGVTGNQKDLPIFDTQSGYPFLGNGYGHKLESKELYFNFSKSTTWHTTNASVLHIYSRIGNPTSQVKYELLNDTNQAIVGELPIGSNYYLARNDHSKSNFDYVLDWRGELKSRENMTTTVIRDINKQFNTHLLKVKNSMAPENTSQLVNAIPGTYKIRISVLKIFGNPYTQEDWHSWISPSFSIVG